MNDRCARRHGQIPGNHGRYAGGKKSPSSEIWRWAPPETVQINSLCTVFAESEVVSLIARGEKPGGIRLGLHHLPFATRIATNGTPYRNLRKGLFSPAARPQTRAFIGC